MVAPISREAILANHFLLRHLGLEQQRRLDANATIVHYPAQSTIFQKGDASHSLIAVCDGRMKICLYYFRDGKELILNIIDRGGMFGEIAVLDGQPRSADAVAAENSELLVLQRRHLMPLITGDPVIAARLIAVLCQRLRQSSEQLEDALLRDAASRLAGCLLRLGSTFGKPESNSLRLNINGPLTRFGST